MANKLFVGGLSWNTSDELLRDAFSIHGDVVEAKVLTEPRNGGGGGGRGVGWGGGGRR
jgi:cold-inducible RNA-binding protein